MLNCDHFKPLQSKLNGAGLLLVEKLINGSMYRHVHNFGRSANHHLIVKEAQSFASKWLPDPCCVMDLALVNDELYVIEFNCIFSGFMTMTFQQSLMRCTNTTLGHNNDNDEDKRLGALYGAIVGDAVGVPYEFKKPSNIPQYDQIDMIPQKGISSRGATLKLGHTLTTVGSCSVSLSV